MSGEIVKLRPTAADDFREHVAPLLDAEVEAYVLIVKVKGRPEYSFHFDSGDARDRFGIAGRLQTFANYLTRGLMEGAE